MKYIDFAEQFKDFPVINITDVKTAFPDFDHRRVYEWQKAGYLKKVARNFYVFSNKTLREQALCFIANKLREPSYLSLEYALSRYGLIPEQVFVLTGISTRTTAVFNTPIGNFSYRTVKRSLFFGYWLKGDDKFKYRIAEPEKAMLDFLYLRPDLKSESDLRELRLNIGIMREIVNYKKLDSYLAIFDSPTLSKKVELLKNYAIKYD